MECDHVSRTMSKLLALLREDEAVTVEGSIALHCHVCSGVHKIPDDLIRRAGVRPQPSSPPPQWSGFEYGEGPWSLP